MSGAAAQLVAVQRTLSSLESAAAAATERAAAARERALAASNDARRLEKETRESLERHLVAETRAELSEAAAAAVKAKRKKEKKERSFRERVEASRSEARSQLLSRVADFASLAEGLWKRSCPLMNAQGEKEAEEEARKCLQALEREEEEGAARKRKVELATAAAAVKGLRERLSAVVGAVGGGGGEGDEDVEAALRARLTRARALESASYLE